MLSSSSREGEAAAWVLSRPVAPPEVGIVLGSGLGGFAEALSGGTVLGYGDIPGMPVSGVSGHAGRLWLGEVEGRSLACLQGRVHAYEGFTPAEVCFGVRLLSELGCHTVLLTNAAGGIRDDLSVGELMLICDHLNLSGQNPLAGPLAEGLQRFVDMSEAYDADLRVKAARAAERVGLRLPSGIYASLLGPSYETPAEVRMLARLGADAVGMSTVFEVLALRQRGVRVGAVSFISNRAAGLSESPLSHDEVKAAASVHGANVVRFLRAWIAEVGP
jgi:purine-nucleoside phosphorylase